MRQLFNVKSKIDGTVSNFFVATSNTDRSFVQKVTGHLKKADTTPQQTFAQATGAQKGPLVIDTGNQVKARYNIVAEHVFTASDIETTSTSTSVINNKHGQPQKIVGGKKELTQSGQSVLEQLRENTPENIVNVIEDLVTRPDSPRVDGRYSDINLYKSRAGDYCIAYTHGFFTGADSVSSEKYVTNSASLFYDANGASLDKKAFAKPNAKLEITPL